ncbi:MAG: hypothetical protein ACKVJU_18340 [Verrucomicrobiales bacterium]
MRNRLITFLVFGAILVGIGEWDLRKRKIEPIQNFNDWWLELCVANSRDKISDPAVTFIRITDDYKPLDLGLNDDPNADPDATKKLTRLDYATILGALEKLNPKSIAFEPVPEFDKDSMFNQTDIEPLKDAALPLPRMTLGAVVSADGDAGGAEYPALSFEGDAAAIREFKRTVKSPDHQLLVNGDPAFTFFEDAKQSSGSGVVRIPLLARQGKKVVPSFVLNALINDAGATVDQVKVTLAGAKSSIQIGEGQAIPISGEGMLTIPAYSGVKTKMVSDQGKDSEKHHFATLTIDQIHIPGEQNDEVAKDFITKFRRELDSVSENTVLIGFDRSIDRQFNLENGDQLSRAGLFARAIATVQSGRYIDWWPYWLRWVAITAILALAFFLFSLPRAKSITFSLLGSLAILAMLVVIFKATLTWTPPFAIVSLLGLLFIVSLILPGVASSGDSSDLTQNDDEDESSAEKAT